MEKNDRSNKERMRNQDDEHEQGTQGDQDKMSERQPDPLAPPRDERAVGQQKQLRTEDTKKKSER